MQCYSGLSNPTHDAQQWFRQLLLAMSEPGTCITNESISKWGRLSSASVATLLTLCDAQTSVYLSPSMADDKITRSVQFHTQATLSEAKNAQFAFITADEFVADTFNQGDETFPEQSTTVVIQLDSLTQGQSLTLSGAGIKTSKNITPLLSPALLRHYLEQSKHYPLGIDTLLVCKHQLLAIPRSTRVTLSEAN